MSEVTSKVVEVITQLQGVVTDHAADAVNLGLSVVTIGGWNDIISSFFWLFISCIGLLIGWKIFNDVRSAIAATKEKSDFYHKDFSDYPASVIPMILIFIFFGISFIVSLCNLFDMWKWIAIFQPKIALAHQILAKVVN